MKKISLLVAFFFVFSAKGMQRTDRDLKELLDNRCLKNIVFSQLEDLHAQKSEIIVEDLYEIDRDATIKLPFYKKKLHSPRCDVVRNLLILKRSVEFLNKYDELSLYKKSKPIVLDFVKKKSKEIIDFCKKNQVFEIENLYDYSFNFTQKVILKIFPWEKKKINALKKKDTEILDKIIKDTSRIYKKSCDEQKKIESQKKEFEDKLKDAKRIYCDVVVRCSDF